jgi:hypothetical protein
MKNFKNKKIIFILLLAVLIFPFETFAHQPKLSAGLVTAVPEPEISKAYYAKLSGAPQVYDIVSSQPFELYVNLLVPDIAGQKRDIQALVIRSGDIWNNPIAILDGTNFEWQKFFEPFGHDTYWQGPEYKMNVEAGKYQVIISSSRNDSQYALAIGEKETFGLKEGISAIHLIPQIKKNFFHESPINFILSPFGWGLILTMFLLSALLVLLLKLIIRKIFHQGGRRNIGKKDRLIRVTLGAVMSLFAMLTSWHPLLFLLAGILFFTAIFPWCGLYAILGTSTVRSSKTFD